MRSSFATVLIGALAAAALLGLAGPGFAATPASVAPPAVATPAPAATPDPAAVLANDQQTLAQLQTSFPSLPTTRGWRPWRPRPRRSRPGLIS